MSLLMGLSNRKIPLKRLHISLHKTTALLACPSRKPRSIDSARDEAHPAASMARLSGNIDPEMNSPIQLHRFASMCHAIASAEDGAGSGMSLRISLPSSQPQLCE